MEERRIREHDVTAEIDRFDAAVQTADAAMARIGTGPGASSGATPELVDAHRAILGSPELADEARMLIRRRRIGAEWAVRAVVEELRRAFSDFTDERLRARIEDVEAVARRLLGALLAAPELAIDDQFRGAVAIGEDISALDAVELYRLGAVGFATEHGGPTSHTTIVAREFGIPYVFGVRGLLACIRPAERIWVDGTKGEVVSCPDENTIREFEARTTASLERERAVSALMLAPAITLDGTAISIGANVESSAQVTEALESGADHIGLVRTELLFAGRRALPTEEEQYELAVEIMRCARGRPVTFRTLDISEEKLPAGVHLDPRANPALGMRGIRLSLRRLDMYRTQLRALYRAASTGSMQILLPLVSTVDELRQARMICAQVCRDLNASGLCHNPEVPFGVMIETPSAALTADHLAAECEFLSIGTNDLVQYAFAADRQNEDMSFLYQPLHPAVLRALELVLSAARRLSRPVSLCGDMAGDPAMTGVLLGLGLRSLSMAAHSVRFVKSAVRAIEISETIVLVREAMALTTYMEVLTLARSRMGRGALLGPPSQTGTQYSDSGLKGPQR